MPRCWKSHVTAHFVFQIPAKDVSIVHNFKKMLEPTWVCLNCFYLNRPLVGHPEPEKKNSVGIFEYILASMLKVYLDVF